MKKMILLALVLFGSVGAEARYHDEVARVQVGASACTLLGALANPSMTCVRNSLGNSTVNFGEAFTEVPYCFMGTESAASVISFTPGLSSVAISAAALLTGAGINTTYSLHCFGI